MACSVGLVTVCEKEYYQKQGTNRTVSTASNKERSKAEPDQPDHRTTVSDLNKRNREEGGGNNSDKYIPYGEGAGRGREGGPGAGEDAAAGTGLDKHKMPTQVFFLSNKYLQILYYSTLEFAFTLAF